MRQFFAWLLIAVGAIWLVLAGGCTLTFLVGSLAPLLHQPDPSSAGMGMLPIIFFCGVVGIVPAVLILWGGLALRPRRPSPLPPGDAP
jgi:hypothetical protein